MTTLRTRASSINRALDQIGDKWCLLIIQEIFWGINSFSEMQAAMGVSRGVLSNRLKWLQSVDCLQKLAEEGGGKHLRYHLTKKSVDLYDSALMAVNWERRFFNTPALDGIELVHHNCRQPFLPVMVCLSCDAGVDGADVIYQPGPGATMDERQKKVRRRSSLAMDAVPSRRSLYKNLIDIIGDRWTANLIALTFHGLRRFEQFHAELPVATNILADRLRFLVESGIFEQSPYQRQPLRYEYGLTEKGEALYPWFLALLQWGDKWCDDCGNGKPMQLTHKPCGGRLHGQVICSQCEQPVKAHQVTFSLGD